MKRSSLLIIWTLITCSTPVNHADNTSGDTLKQVKTEFDDFTNLFENSLTKIPDNYSLKYLGADSSRLENASFKTLELKNFSDSIVGLIYKVECRAGGLCETIFLSTFDLTGKRIDDLEIGHSYADNSFSRTLEYTISNNSISLKYQETESKEDEEGNTIETIKKEEKIESYSVDVEQGTITKN